MTKILWYLLFLGATIPLTGIYLWWVYTVTSKLEQPPWLDEILALTFASEIYLYGLLLARYSSFLIPGFYFVAAQVPIVVNAAFSTATVEEDRSCYWAETSWAGKCIRQTWLPVTQIIVVVALGLVISVLEGVVYFTTPVPSTQATLAFIRFPMLTVFIASAIFLPMQVIISQSGNLSVGSRRRLLSVSLARLVPTGMILATLLWTFSSSAKASDHTGVRFHLTYFPLVLSILAAYFVIILLPSIIGITRSKRWQSLLLERRTDAMTETIQILRTPKVDFHIPALRTLITRLQEKQVAYIKGDECIKLGLYLDRLKAEKNASVPTMAVWEEAGFYRATSDPTNVHSQPPSETKERAHFDEGAVDQISAENNEDYYQARPHDPRFQYLDWLDWFVDRLHMTTNDLQVKSEPAAELGAALAWADSYVNDRRELMEKASLTKTNALSAAIASTLVTSVLGVFFTGFGSWLWTYVASTLPS
jgi:uncharacterized protein YjeT (DUF2065 family)